MGSTKEQIARLELRLSMLWTELWRAMDTQLRATTAIAAQLQQCKCHHCKHGLQEVWCVQDQVRLCPCGCGERLA